MGCSSQLWTMVLDQRESSWMFKMDGWTKSTILYKLLIFSPYFPISNSYQVSFTPPTKFILRDSIPFRTFFNQFILLQSKVFLDSLFGFVPSLIVVGALKIYLFLTKPLQTLRATLSPGSLGDTPRQLHSSSTSPASRISVISSLQGRGSVFHCRKLILIMNAEYTFVFYF